MGLIILEREAGSMRASCLAGWLAGSNGGMGVWVAGWGFWKEGEAVAAVGHGRRG